MKKLLLIIFTVILITACSPKIFNVNSLSKMKWIEGVWVFTENGLKITETWSYNHKVGFNGISTFVYANDTLLLEHNEISFDNKNNIFYTSKLGTLKEENLQMKLTHLTSNKIRFEDIKQNKTVTYRKRSNNIMELIVVEKENNENKTTKFKLSKITK